MVSVETEVVVVLTDYCGSGEMRVLGCIWADVNERGIEDGELRRLLGHTICEHYCCQKDLAQPTLDVFLWLYMGLNV